ncbi:unnamed protein product [Closterium sp. NIES-64]|nr:unnamed protein product [Closterium sp. NIES-64]
MRPDTSSAAEPPSSSRAAQQQPNRPAAAEPPSSSRAARYLSRPEPPEPPEPPESPEPPEPPEPPEQPEPPAADLPDSPIPVRLSAAAMATPNVLTFDAEGRAIDFAVWIEDLQLYLLCDAVDEVSLFDFVSGAVPAPPADADSAVRSKWATRDAAARLAVRRHLPSSERAHFSQCKTAQAFDTRYRAALPAEFRAANPPPMYITLYFLVTRLPESLRVVRDQFLSVCPTTLTVDLLEESLLAAEKSIVAVGASRGDPRTPSLRGVVPPPCCPLSPLPLRPTSLVLSRSARRLPPVADAALARARGARERVEPEGAVEEAVGVEGGVGVAGGVVAGVEVVVAAVEAEVAAEVVAEEAVGAVGATVLVGEVAVATGVAVEAGVGGGGGGRSGSSQRSSSGGGQRQQQQQQQPAAAAAAAAALSHRPRPSAAP